MDTRILIAETIRDRRKELGLNQNELAKKAGITQARVSELENISRNCRIETLLKTLDALDLEIIVQAKQESNGADFNNDELDELLGLKPRSIRMALPHPNCYAIPGKPVIVGSYPGDKDSGKARQKVRALLESGVDYFIDLTSPSERLSPYKEILFNEAGPNPIEYRSFPIPEGSAPSAEDVNRILDAIDAAISAHHLVYVHCRGGIGRAGTIAGCYFVRHGIAGAEALAEVQRLFETFSPERVRAHPEGSPQHDSQRQLVREWKAHDRHIPLIDVMQWQNDRYVGALVGLAVGDALGTTVEFKERGTFSPVTDIIGGGPFRLKPGQWTDDTSMALCLGESLIANKAFDPADQMRRYVSWWKDGHFSSTGTCFDIGPTTRKALEVFQRSGQAFSGSEREDSAGNGSLMRLAPVAIFFEDAARLAIEMAGQSSRTTHGAKAAVDACRYFAGLLIGAIRGAPKSELLAAMYSPIPGLWDEEPLHPEIAAIARGSFRLPDACVQVGGMAYVVNTLRLALWAFSSTDDFRTGALAAVNLGGDADTTGAVYGQLAGAYYGLESIPAKWRKRITLAEEIERVGQDLSVGPEGISPARRLQARQEARECLAWAGGDYRNAVARMQKAIDDAGHGSSMGVMWALYKAKHLLETQTVFSAH